MEFFGTLLKCAILVSCIGVLAWEQKMAFCKLATNFEETQDELARPLTENLIKSRVPRLLLLKRGTLSRLALYQSAVSPLGLNLAFAQSP